MSIVIPSVCVQMGQLGTALSRAVRSIEELGYLRAGHSNLLVFHEAVDDQELGKWIDSLTLVNPSRVFVLSLDDSASEISLDVGGRCHRVSPSVILCSEVARIVVPRSQLAELPSVLRAHMLSGAPIEAVVLQGAIPEWVEGIAGSLAQTVYLDTRHTVGAAHAIPRFWYRKERVIDIAWMWLAPWREVIRLSFDRNDLCQRLSSLNQITFKVSSRDDVSIFSSLLLPGWMQDRLGLELREVRGSRVNLIGASGREVEFRFEAVQDAPSGLRGLSFSDAEGVPFLELRLEDDLLEGQFNKSGCWAPLRRCSEQGSRELLERYFLIGASMTHYPMAFRHAVRFHEGGMAIGNSA